MTTIIISGMSCGHCTASVTKTLEAIPGITNVTVSLNPGQASFDCQPGLDLDAVKAAIRKIGFEPEG